MPEDFKRRLHLEPGLDLTVRGPEWPFPDSERAMLRFFFVYGRLLQNKFSTCCFSKMYIEGSNGPWSTGLGLEASSLAKSVQYNDSANANSASRRGFERDHFVGCELRRVSCVSCIARVVARTWCSETSCICIGRLCPRVSAENAKEQVSAVSLCWLGQLLACFFFCFWKASLVHSARGMDAL